MYALFNHDQASTLYALIWDRKAFYFSEILMIIVKYFWEQLGIISKLSLIMNEIASYPAV